MKNNRVQKEIKKKIPNSKMVNETCGTYYGKNQATEVASTVMIKKKKQLCCDFLRKTHQPEAYKWGEEVEKEAQQLSHPQLRAT